VVDHGDTATGGGREMGAHHIVQRGVSRAGSEAVPPGPLPDVELAGPQRASGRVRPDGRDQCCALVTGCDRTPSAPVGQRADHGGGADGERDLIGIEDAAGEPGAQRSQVVIDDVGPATSGHEQSRAQLLGTEAERITAPLRDLADAAAHAVVPS
jgi:hypothetical protein